MAKKGKPTAGKSARRIASSRTKVAAGKRKAQANAGKSVAAKRPAKAVAYARAKRAYVRYGDEIRKLPGVTGLSVGPRFRKGRPTREMTIRLHVSTDAAKRDLKENADKYGFKKYYGKVGTDIVVWNFHTASSGTCGPLPDGTAILGNGGTGTLGTTVIVRLKGKPTTVWLTAAHVASGTPPTAPVAIHLPGESPRIGAVSRAQYFRDQNVDAAFIVPDDVLPVKSTSRTIRHLVGSDIYTAVSMKGAVTPPGVGGKIISLDFDDSITSPQGPEPIVDHFLVQAERVNFAVGGDSGAVVFKKDQLVGLLRAVDVTSGIAVVTKLDIVRAEAGGFRL